MTEVHRGLHAKLVWARSPRGDDLWLGSANLTGRGWRGLNAEVVAHLRVTPSIGNDLAELVDGLEEIPLEEILTEESDEEIEGADALDKLRNRIAGSWCGELQRMDQSGRWRCTTSTPPMTQTDKAVLSARLLGQHHSQAVTWAADRREVDFEQTQPHEETELVVLQLVWNEDAEVRASWVQRAPMNPPPSPERDREALGRLMGPRAMLAWIRSILEEFSGEAEDSPWPKPNGRPGGSGAAARPTKPPTPSLEAVLRAWIRDPKCVREADRVLQTWAKAAKTGVNGDPEAFAELERFQKAWEIVRDGLGAGSH